VGISLGGFIMEQMAQDLGEDATSAYTIGLLHGIGKLVISSHPTLEYADVFEAVEKKGISVTDAERLVWGVSSPEVGAELLRRWSFPDAIVVPILNQDRPARAPSYRKQACMLHLSIWTVAALGLNHGKDAWAMTADPFALHTQALRGQDAGLHRQRPRQLAQIKALLTESITRTLCQPPPSRPPGPPPGHCLD
jgi:HD-like signal output (HDOD) protein